MKNKKQKTTFPREVLRYLLISVGSGLLLFFFLFIGNDLLYREFLAPRREEAALEEAQSEFQDFVTDQEASSRARFTWQSSSGTVFYLHNDAQGGNEPNIGSGNEPPNDRREPVQLGTERTVSITYEDAIVSTVFLVVETRGLWYAGIVVAMITALGFAILLFYRQLIKKAKYMNEIEKGTFILESGQLNYRLPEYGNDELTQIAHSINQMSQSLSEKIASEAQATQASRDIIGDLSHDIRTPLTILTGYVPILLETDLTTDQRKYLQLIDKKTKQMNTRVNDLLDYSTIFSGEQSLNLEPVNIRVLLEQFATELAAVTEVELNLEIPQKTMIIGDIKLLERLFDNLVSNIHQHADLEKGIALEGIIGEGEVQITVTNEISQDDMSMGKSLGVKISVMIVEMHNGTLSSEMIQNQYTSMIRIPLKKE